MATRTVTITPSTTVREVTITVLETTTTSEFEFLLSKKFNAGFESNLPAGWSLVEFDDFAFDDANYTVVADGYNGIDKVDGIIGDQSTTGFYVYLPDSVTTLKWQAIKH